MTPHPWRWLLELVVVVLAMVACFFVAAIAQAATQSVTVMIMLFTIAPIGVSWAAERYAKGSWHTMGLGNWRTALVGLGAGTAVAAILLVSIVGLVVALTSAHLVPLGGERMSNGALLQFGVAGIMEEFLVRGAVLRILSRRFGSSVAILATAIGFALLHLGNDGMSISGFVNVLLAGLLLGVIVERLGSLTMAIAFHSTWNILLALFVGAVSGNGGGGMLSRLDAAGLQPWEQLLSGGAFGLEESILTTIALAVAIVAVVRSPWYDAYTIAARERQRLGIERPSEATSSVSVP